jgi:hypothetical protein
MPFAPPDKILLFDLGRGPPLVERRAASCAPRSDQSQFRNLAAPGEMIDDRIPHLVDLTANQKLLDHFSALHPGFNFVRVVFVKSSCF